MSKIEKPKKVSKKDSLNRGCDDNALIYKKCEKKV